MLTVEVRVAGRRRNLLPKWQVPFPPEPIGQAGPITLRELVTRVVLAEVAGYRDRQSGGDRLRVLRPDEIDDGVAVGRVVPGRRDLRPRVDPDDDTAVGQALIGFEDGLYLVFLDGLEHRDLDEQVFPGPDSTLTFVRLVMLAGALG